MIEREEILRMAEQAGIKGPAPARQGFKMYASPDRLRRFAELVAAAERETCAKLFDGEVWAYDYREIAAAIRARGEQ